MLLRLLKGHAKTLLLKDGLSRHNNRCRTCAAFRQCQTETSSSVLVSVEGNIGAGKSSVLPLIEQNENLRGEAELHPEPLDKWQRVGEEEGTNILAAFYKNPHRWAYTFQSYVFITRFQQHHAARMNAARPLLLAERSVFTDRCVFGKTAIEDGLMNSLERGIYNDWFESVVSALPNLIPDLFVYIRADPSVCHERLRERARSEEAGVSLEYLERLHSMHEHWFIDGALPAQIDDHGQFRPCASGMEPTQDGNVWAAVMDERRCHPLIRNKGALIVESNRQLPIQRRPELVHGLQNLLARLLSGRGLINIP